MKPQAFLDLKELSTEIHHFNSILSLLHWDQETYMPKGGIVARSHQISQLSTLVHEKKTSRAFKKHLSSLLHMASGKPKVKGLTKADHAMLREWHKQYVKATLLPASFVKTFAQVSSEATQVWSTAKKDNNFKVFAPFLKKIIDLCREKANILGFEEHPYDALLEGYEPCMTTRKVEAIFHSLQKELTKLLKKIRDAKQINDDFLHKKVAPDTQRLLGELLLSKLPIDPAYSRLDLSSHPFSMALHPHDSRITTRILPNHFLSNLFSVLHEAGHSMYEMGLPTETWGTPLSEYISLSIHESQSRWWETLIGRSLPFWRFFYPHLKKELPFLKNITLDRFYKASNKVTPSLIRVEADEVTYCLHVILRFEIEKELITGQLDVNDLPFAWNAKMKEYFDLTPPSDSQGCLQDIHWSLGDFGYFPTYALGNLFAAQFFTTFAKAHPTWETKVESGELGFIRDWLKKNVHCHGKMYDSETLLKKVTGKPLSEAAYCSYLKNKYSEIYSL